MKNSDVKLRECREAFEAWYLGENPTNTDMRSIARTADYELMTTRINWIAWQAAWNHQDHLLKMAADALQLSLDDADGCELNMSNYHHDDVHSLNDAYVRLFQGIEQTLLTLQQHGYGKE